MEAFTREFNEESHHVNVYLFTASAFTRAYPYSEISADKILLQSSVAMVTAYGILFLGGFSVIHLRRAVAGIAILAVFLARIASEGLATYLGAKTAVINNLLTFLLLGIGANNTFLIVTAID